MKGSPYWVEPADRPKKAIEFALENGLTKKHKINEKAIRGYLNSKNNIPIWFIEAACKINEKYIEIPIQYQNIWLCLHGTRLERTQPNGRTFNPKVHFPPVYVEGKDVKSILMDAVKICGGEEAFVNLCGPKNKNIYYDWTKRQYSVPISAIMKAAQILGKDYTSIISNHFICGKTNKSGRVYFNQERSKDLEIILNWIKTEGHLEIGCTHIEINQLKRQKERLMNLKRLFIEIFRMKPTSLVLYEGNKWNGLRLIISSSPLRAIFSIVYNVPIGYKTNSLIEDKKLNLMKYSKEEKLKILTSFCETEGSFHGIRSHGKPSLVSPRFEFKVFDKELANACSNLFKNLNYNVREIYNSEKAEYSIGIYKHKDVIRLCFELYPYLSKELLRKIIRILSIKTLLSRIFFRSNDISTLIRDARNNYNYKKDFIDQLVNEYTVKYKSNYMCEWVNGKSSVPLSAILLACQILNKNVFDYIPKYMAILLYAQKLIIFDKLTKLRRGNY